MSTCCSYPVSLETTLYSFSATIGWGTLLHLPFQEKANKASPVKLITPSNPRNGKFNVHRHQAKPARTIPQTSTRTVRERKPPPCGWDCRAPEIWLQNYVKPSLLHCIQSPPKNELSKKKAELEGRKETSGGIMKSLSLQNLTLHVEYHIYDPMHSLSV